MKRVLSVIVLLTFMTAMVSAQSWQLLNDAQSKEQVAKICAAHKRVKTIKSKFKQTKESAMLSQPLVSEGNLEYSSAANFIKWEYVSPFYSCFQMKDNKVSVKQGSGAKKSSSAPGAKMFQGLANIMMSAFNGKSLSDTKNFNCQVYRSGNVVSVWLSPKKAMMKKAFKQMKMYFNPKTSIVDKLEIIGANGDTTTIEFTGLKVEN